MNKQEHNELLQHFQKVRPNLIYDKHVKLNVISGTDIGAIMGYNPYTTIYDVWLKRKYGFVSASDNPYTKAGISLEPIIARQYYLKAKRKEDKTVFINRGKHINHHTHAFMGGTPDYLVRNHQNKWGLEVKTSQTLWEEVPKHYELQCHWYMELLQYTRWDLIVLANGFNYKEYAVQHDADLIAFMKETASNFYDKYLVGGGEPFDLSLHQKTKNIIVDPTLDNLAHKRDSLKNQYKAIEDELSLVERDIKTIIGENSGVNGRCYQASWNTQYRESIDYKKMIEDYAIDVNQYKREGIGFRVLRVKKLLDQ